MLQRWSNGDPGGICPRMWLWLTSMFPIYQAEANDFGIVPSKLLYDKSIVMKYDPGPKESGMLPLSAFRLKFKFKILEFNKLVGIVPDSLLTSRFSVERTSILPSQSGIGPEIWFEERSKSARR